MKSPTKVAATVAAALSLSVIAVAVPAQAAPSADSNATFEVLAGTLDITVPATADLGIDTPSATLSGQLGSVTVMDGRASADGSWQAAVSTTDFRTRGGVPSETVSANDVFYWSGPATATTGDGTFTPGQVDAAAVDRLGDLSVAFTHVGGTGNNTATWNPTLVVNIPLFVQAGIYTGTVTHSVA